MSLGTKTAALLAVVVFVVLATVSAVALRYQERSIERTIFDGVDGQARVAAHGIAAFVWEGLAETAAVAAALPRGALGEERRGELQDYLARMLSAFPKFQNGIFVLDPGGAFIADYPPHPELRGESFAFREYYRRTILENRAVVSSPYRSKRTNRPVLTFTAPVLDAAGRLVAIVACSVDLLAREALGGYREQKYGDTGYLYVFDHSRLLVIHPEDDRLLTQVEKGKNTELEAALLGFEGTGYTVNSKGVDMLLAVRRVPGTDWIVGVQVGRREALRPIAEARVEVFSAAVAVFVLVILLGAVVIRRVSRPLQQLERATFQLGAEVKGGTASAARTGSPIAMLESIQSRDEIGRLAYSFRQLVASLDDRNRLEEELRRAHRMEAVGRLAGGVAHEFNNMLAVILSAARHLRTELPPQDPLREETEEIVATAERAAAITRQLLAFSRREAPEPETFDLAEAVRGDERMLRRVVGDGVVLETVTPATPALIHADPRRIEQAILSLASNAWDAMRGSGRLRIEVALVEGEGLAATEKLPPGPFVELSVSDTGVGMDEKTVARIFDPFFTTKEVGEGPGLGLSTVYGAVQQSGGVLRVTTAPGKGTTFRIYFPRAASTSGRASPPQVARLDEVED